MKVIFAALSCFFSLTSVQSQWAPKVILGEDMRLQKITEGAWRHESTMETEEFGKVWCNGMVFASGGKCIVFDTPASDSLSGELIHYLEDSMGLEIQAVVINHFHFDCLGGLKAFHGKGIPSYSSRKTAVLAEKEAYTVPQRTFKKKERLQMDGKEVVLYYPGAAHAPDNIVAYLPTEKVLFGGCMVKSAKAGKGWLGDADLTQWPKTLEKVRKKFGEAEWVIPGHGNVGDLDLLEGTVRIISAP